MPTTTHRITRSTKTLAYAVADADGYIPSLKELVSALNSSDGPQMLKNAYVTNMHNKKERYAAMVSTSQDDLAREEKLIDQKMPDLKRKAEAVVSDNWSIFESVSKKYMDARDSLAAFEVVLSDAEYGIHRMEEDDSYAICLRDELVASLEALTNFSAQANIVDAAVNIVSQFLKSPLLLKTKFLNFVLAGAAGTGKTTLVNAIARVFANAGIFVYNRVREAGRADLVGEYEGQTVAKTRGFLLSSLESTIFIDEAYALTTWSDGKPECYGSEAITTLLHFMTKFKGCYALFVAGYEKEMVRYFLPINPGLRRRFPYRFVLNDLTPAELIQVFQRSLLLEMGVDVPEGRQEHLKSADYFTLDAWNWLQRIIVASTSGELAFHADGEYDAATRQTYPPRRVFRPTYPHMATLFQNQAGSMTNLAEEGATVLARAVSFASASHQMAKRRKRKDWQLQIEMQEIDTMKCIIHARIQNSAMSQVSAFLEELQQIERCAL